MPAPVIYSALDELPEQVGWRHPLPTVSSLITSVASCDDIRFGIRAPVLTCLKMFASALKAFGLTARQTVSRHEVLRVARPQGKSAVIATTILAGISFGAGCYERLSGHERLRRFGKPLTHREITREPADTIRLAKKVPSRAYPKLILPDWRAEGKVATRARNVPWRNQPLTALSPIDQKLAVRPATVNTAVEKICAMVDSEVKA